MSARPPAHVYTEITHTGTAKSCALRGAFYDTGYEISYYKTGVGG